MHSTSYWVGTVSKNHVLRGVAGEFCQVCHGKKGSLAKMKEGDWLIYYSPKNDMDGNEKCQKFTAIGTIRDKHLYQFDMGNGFIPWRRDVDYQKDINEVPIVPLLKQLSFTKDKKNWGMAFRNGLFKITREDFEIICNKMLNN